MLCALGQLVGGAIQITVVIVIVIEMYSGHGRLYVCLSVLRHIPSLLHGVGYNLEEWQELPPSCALLDGFAIGARVSLL